MNKGGHLLNAVLLSAGIGFALAPSGDAHTFLAILKVTPPIVLGVLLPDADAAVGRHRKTLHNLPVLAFFLIYPFYFGNLQYVWIGVATHYVLDLFASRRGLALLYPWGREFSAPVAVPASGLTAMFVILVITALELAVASTVISFGGGLPTAGEFLTVVDGLFAGVNRP